MGQRTELHEVLRSIMEQARAQNGPPSAAQEDGRHVYFQPPENLKIAYPCIVYERSGMDIRYAENRPYANKKRYTVTVIDREPDSPIPDLLAQMPMCSFDRHFVSDNLNHDVFTIYY